MCHRHNALAYVSRMFAKGKKSYKLSFFFFFSREFQWNILRSEGEYGLMCNMNCFSDMVSEWPRQQAQTQSALKKKKPLEEKILAAIEKRVSHLEEMLKPAAENSSVSQNIMKEAEETAQAVAKVCIFQLLMCN